MSLPTKHTSSTNKEAMPMECEVCGKKPTLDEVIFSRGYFWHKPCCQLIVVNRYELVDFPSDGKCIPNTILTQ